MQKKSSSTLVLTCGKYKNYLNNWIEVAYFENKTKTIYFERINMFKKVYMHMIWGILYHWRCMLLFLVHGASFDHWLERLYGNV